LTGDDGSAGRGGIDAADMDTAECGAQNDCSQEFQGPAAAAFAATAGCFRCGHVALCGFVPDEAVRVVHDRSLIPVLDAQKY
jgi:hypothetical protein